jgi:hypothetical protein
MNNDLNMFLQRWTQYRYLYIVNPNDANVKDQLEIFEDVLEGYGIADLKISFLNNSKCEISYIVDGREKYIEFPRNQIDRYII